MALQVLTVARRQHGQVLVFVALVLPIVLLPAAAFAVDSAAAASAQANLEQSTASAAESAAQQIDQAALRSGAGLALDRSRAESIAREVVSEEDPDAGNVRVTMSGLDVTVEASESLRLPLGFMGTPAVGLHAAATARLAPGYESPSSFLPFSVSTF
jgi:hypothetical protein